MVLLAYQQHPYPYDRHNIPSLSQDTYLPDGHGAQNVEEDKGTISDIVAHQIAVGNSSEEREGLEWKFGDHMPVKTVQRQIMPTLYQWRM